MTYDIDRYRLELCSDFKTLYVKDRSTGEEETSYNLQNDAVRIEVINNEYDLNTDGIEGPTHDQGFHTKNDEFAFDYNGNRENAGGLGIIDIRDPNAPNEIKSIEAEVTYHMCQCPIEIRYDTGKPENFRVVTKCAAAGCYWPNSECRSYEEQ